MRYRRAWGGQSGRWRAGRRHRGRQSRSALTGGRQAIAGGSPAPGVCGATYVTSVFLLIPEIGVAPTIGLTVAGQQLASMLVDRYGLLRLPRRPISPRRLAGVAALLGGVALLQG